MCIRYIDFVDDEAHVAGFLSAVTKKIKKAPRVRLIRLRSAKYHELRLLEKRRYRLRDRVDGEHRSIPAYFATVQRRRGTTVDVC